jgi:hypothetical protein
MFHALFREIEPQPLGVARWGIARRAPARRAQLPGVGVLRGPPSEWGGGL